MDSFDVGSIFRNIPLRKTIDLFVDILFQRKTSIDALTKERFQELFTISMFESLVLFVGEYYQQTDGVSLGFPPCPILNNVFLCYNGDIWLENCPLEFEPFVYRRYLDDTLLLFRSRKHFKKLPEYFSCQHSSTKFTFEVKENEIISFLDTKITKKNISFLLQFIVGISGVFLKVGLYK